MSNKPKSSVTPINAFIQGKASPKEVIAAANASQNAKAVADSVPVAKAEPEAPKAPEAVVEDVTANDTATTEPEAPKTGTGSATGKRTNKTLSRKEWVAIIKKYHESDKTAAEIAEEHSVSAGSVYKWASDLKKEEDEAAKAEEAAKLTPTSVVDDTKKLLEGVDSELAAFDAKIQAAKDLVANSVSERKKIEDSKKKYQQIIELLS